MMVLQQQLQFHLVANIIHALQVLSQAILLEHQVLQYQSPLKQVLNFPVFQLQPESVMLQHYPH
jgi:hypothetical protein